MIFVLAGGFAAQADFAYPVFTTKQFCRRAFVRKTSADDLLRFFPTFTRYLEVLNRFKWVGGSADRVSVYEGLYKTKDATLILTAFREPNETLIRGGGLSLRIYAPANKRESIIAQLEKILGSEPLPNFPRATQDQLYLARYAALMADAGHRSKVSISEDIASALYSGKPPPRLVEYDIIPNLYEFTSMAKTPLEEAKKIAAKLQDQSLAVRRSADAAIILATHAKDMTAIERQAYFEGFFNVLEQLTAP